MKQTSVALSLAHTASAARPCAAAAGVVVATNFGGWSQDSMTLKRSGYGDITARPRRPRRRPT